MRLTYRDSTVPHTNAKGELWEAYSDANYNEIINKLAAYEDAEEQGRLVILPCGVKINEVRINLNETVKVKLTDLGKDIYYHRFDELNKRYGGLICQPSFPKEDAEGYTKFTLWNFIEIYGEYMGMTKPNVIEPLEIVYELPKEDGIDEHF